jgi:hypothetical protein
LPKNFYEFWNLIGNLILTLVTLSRRRGGAVARWRGGAVAQRRSHHAAAVAQRRSHRATAAVRHRVCAAIAPAPGKLSARSKTKFATNS